MFNLEHVVLHTTSFVQNAGQLYALHTSDNTTSTQNTGHVEDTDDKQTDVLKPKSHCLI